MHQSTVTLVWPKPPPWPDDKVTIPYCTCEDFS